MRLQRDFFTRDVLEVAPDLLGKELNGKIITEVEAYGGEEDLASHARFGKTKRNEVMYGEAGRIYVYLIYGIYWMLNFVTGKINVPQAVLIRGLEGVEGPGKVGKWLGLDKSFNGEDVVTNERMWIKSGIVNREYRIERTRRIGVEYAGEWAKKTWRFKIEKT